jgi:hypothetical protein
MDVGLWILLSSSVFSFSVSDSLFLSIFPGVSLSLNSPSILDFPYFILFGREKERRESGSERKKRNERRCIIFLFHFAYVAVPYQGVVNGSKGLGVSVVDLNPNIPLPT